MFCIRNFKGGRFKNIKSFSKTMFNMELHNRNKDFASKFRDDIEYELLYNTSADTLLNSISVIKKKLNNLIYIGSNPDYFLKNFPKSI